MQIPWHHGGVHRTAKNLLFFVALIVAPAFAADSAVPTSMTITVDATELPRKLLHSKTVIDLPSGRTSMLYVKWVPGIHGPRGPIENIAGIEVHDLDGNEVRWERDWADPFRIYIDADKAGPHRISLTYITNQPSVNSTSIDSYGFPAQGAINWNTVVLYPEGVPVRDIMVTPRLVIPDGWSYGTALTERKRSGDQIVFESTDFEDLIDKPVICGEHFRTIELAKTDNATWFLHLCSEEPGQLPAEDDTLVTPFRRLAHEAEAFFGGTHFDEYHCMLVLNDNVRLGLEHRNSSLNADKADTFGGKPWIDTRIETLIAHEVSHAWIGKYRRPAGMVTDNFHEEKKTDLLWIYEGFDEFAEKVLCVRSGFRGAEHMREELALTASTMLNQKGRQWRPLRDTAASAWTLRGGSKNWHYLRRNQDYYTEGSHIWLEVDMRIRRATGGEKSIDDFSAEFFTRGDQSATSEPFTLDEIIEILDTLAPEPWDSIFAERVERPVSENEIPLGIALSGWELTWSEEPSEVFQSLKKTAWKDTRLYDSVGLSVKDDGTVKEVIPKSAADRAGLYPGTVLVGVNGRKYSGERLEDAVKKSTETGRIELLTFQGDLIREAVIEYDGGLRYYALEQVEGEDDLLDELFTPRVER